MESSVLLHDADIDEEPNVLATAATRQGIIRTIQDEYEKELQDAINEAFREQKKSIRDMAKYQAILDDWGLSPSQDSLFAQGSFHNIPRDDKTIAERLVTNDFYFEGSQANAFTQLVHGPVRHILSIGYGLVDGYKEEQKIKEAMRPDVSKFIKRLKDKRKKFEDGLDKKYGPSIEKLWDAEKYWDFVGKVKSNISKKWLNTLYAIKECKDDGLRNDLINYYREGVRKDIGLLYTSVVPFAGDVPKGALDQEIKKYADIDFNNLGKHLDFSKDVGSRPSQGSKRNPLTGYGG